MSLDYERHTERSPGGEIRDAAPGLARLAAGAGFRSARWAASAYARSASWAIRATVSGRGPVELADEVRDELREQARRLLGIEDLDGLARAVTAGRIGGLGGEQRSSVEILRERGTELLEESAAVGETDGAHPAYARILEALDPDEARILLLFATQGPQESVDVRTWRPLNVGSHLVLQGATMVAAEAGCRHPERIAAYLNNLHRLGLVWFSREPLEDLVGYQVLEAQPQVADAVREAGRARIVRRSLLLTSFGVDFCRTCLPLPEGTEIVGVRTPSGMDAELRRGPSGDGPLDPAPPDEG